MNLYRRVNRNIKNINEPVRVKLDLNIMKSGLKLAAQFLLDF